MTSSSAKPVPVRIWGRTIIIDGSSLGPGADAYQVDVQNILRSIENGSMIGKAILRAMNSDTLASANRLVRILPLEGSEKIQRIESALMEVHGGDPGRLSDADRKNLGAQIRGTAAFPDDRRSAYSVGTPVCFDDPPPATNSTCMVTRVSDGTGSSVVVRFSPDVFRGLDRAAGYDPDIRINPDDVLFHELFHAYRFMRGHDRSNVLVASSNGHVFGSNVEELYAIMITNIYLSEKNRSHSLRFRHSASFDPLPESLRTSFKYWAAFADHIRTLATELGGITGVFAEIAAVNAPWNPLRTHLAELRGF